jgi:hypothetical protein
VDFKVIIQSLLNISPPQQRLIFKGRALKEDKLLSSYSNIINLLE